VLQNAVTKKVPATSEQKDEPSGGMEDLRLRMRNMLETACESGTLRTALGSVKAKDGQKQLDDSEAKRVDELRVHMRGVLEDACKQGVPSEADGHSQEYVVTLDTTGGVRWGLDVDTPNQSSYITAIHGGAAEIWNISNPAKKISVGDRIVKVNHVQGDFLSMMAEVRKPSHLMMTLLRPRKADIPTQEATVKMMGPLLLKEGAMYKKIGQAFMKRAKVGEKIETVVGGKVECTNIAKEGDWVVRADTNCKERYLLPDDKFKKLYKQTPVSYADHQDAAELQSEGFQAYDPCGRIVALEVDAKLLSEYFPQGKFTAAWNSPMLVEVGDYLASPAMPGGVGLPQSIDQLKEVYRIERGAFAATYVKEEEVDVVRVQMRKILERAASSGALQQAFNVVSPKDSPRTSLEAVKSADLKELDKMRHDMRQILASAVDSGKLAETLKKLPSDVFREGKETKDIRVQIRGLLESACNSGELSKALSKLTNKPQGTQLNSPENLRLQMRQVLESAADSGQLESALELTRQKVLKKKQQEETGSSLAAKQKADDSEAEVLKSRVRGLLEKSYNDGSLPATLDKVFSSSIAVAKEEPAMDQAGPGIADLRFKMRELLTSTAGSGDLEKAMDSVRQTKDAKKLEQAVSMREQVRDLLERSEESGELQQALQNLTEQHANKVLEEPRAPPPTPAAGVSHVPMMGRPLPPTAAKPSGQRPMSAMAAHKRETPVQKADLQRPVSAGSARIEVLTEDIHRVKEEQQSLHTVVDDLTRQMEELKRENRSLLDRLQGREQNSSS
jgi:hypothetical protein